MKYLLPILLLSSNVALAGFSISMENSALQREIEEALPDSIKNGINAEVKVEFTKLEIQGKHVMGMVKVNPFNKKASRTVLVNEELLSNNDKAKATILHEIGHIFDNQNLILPVEQELKDKKHYSISDSHIFLNLAGFKGKKQTNKKLSRSVDVYENKNSQEYFAVNLEHFLLDPEYKCRKPSLYSYYSKNLQHVPFEKTECKEEFRLAPSIDMNGKVERQKTLDPSRLYDVHYLFAGRGSNVMSKWGHAMLRLVMCSPSRKEVSEKCLQDRAYHLVISFRADITNFNISYIKGLSGKYPSRMFILSMMDVIKEYTVGELRDLWSIPLKMNPNQKRGLISQVLEKYWAYEGKYYFITNNCADETLALLRNAYPDVEEMVDLNVTTPLGLRNKLEKFDIADMSVFDDREEAKRLGYLFESISPKLERISLLLKNKNFLKCIRKKLKNISQRAL